jgi:hypothetical protein
MEVQTRLPVAKNIQPSQAISIVATSHAEEVGTFLMVDFGMPRKLVAALSSSMLYESTHNLTSQ